MKRFAYIDALRGYAVIGVIAVHSVSAAPVPDGLFKELLQQGARGVQLFYVASAFTLMLSWHARSDGAAPFFARRFFRIAPMYWLAIPVFLLFAGHPGLGLWAPETISVSQILATSSFSSILYPFEGAAIIPGGWTVTTEIGFYILFPIVATWVRSTRAAFLLLVASVWMATRTYPSSIDFLSAFGGDRSLIANFAYFWLPNQFAVFAIGLVVFYVARALSPQILMVELTTGVAAAAVLLLPFTPRMFPIHIEYGLVFGVLLFGLSKGGGAYLVRPIICLYGKISYSAYILHFVMFNCLYLAKANGFDPFGLGVVGTSWRILPLIAVVTLATGALSAITYRVVELPMIRFGERVMGYRSDRHVIAVTPS